ncbi:MAG: hypothetical protein U9R43_05535 [Thermodesulfobacteriota bacterium]|nr:hypothetical protein [Thermodesulfobacteriota bacterium]
MFNTANKRGLTIKDNTGPPPYLIFNFEIGSEFLSGDSTDNPMVHFEDASARYSGMDLDYYRSSMTSYEFRAYIDYIGEEAFESDFLPSDFEIYYPDIED